MPIAADTTDQLTQLREKAERVVELVSLPGASPQPPIETGSDEAASERRWAWYQGVENAVLDLSNALPEGTEDYDARKLFEFLIELRRAITADGDASDARGQVALAALKMGDVMGRIGRRLEHDVLDDPRAAARSIFATLVNVSVGDLARLLGVSTKTVTTWKGGGAVSRGAARVVLVAQLVTYLRPSMTPLGVVMWFDAPRPALGGRTPLQLLDENQAAAQLALVPLARGARGQLAS